MPPFPIIQISSVGWEHLSDQNYHWQGNLRTDVNHVLFQYTISGRGKLKIQEEVYELESGDAFIVTIPSEHEYYFDNTSPHWEFMYVMLSGNEIISMFNYFIEKNGNIHKYKFESEPIRYLRSILEYSREEKINNIFYSSELAHGFAMTLFRNNSISKKIKDFPPNIEKATQYIINNYNTINNIDQIAKKAGLSKYYFLREFQKYTSFTPNEYLSRVRIERAAELLRNSHLSIEEIAKSVGFSNGNYFSKVFNHWIGITPSKFREAKSFMPVDKLIIR